MPRYGFKKLDADQVVEAQRLLYDVYVREMGWIPKSTAPSAIRIERGPEGLILRDRYDEISTWFGVYANDTLASVHRITPAFQGQFELENYQSLPDFIKSGKSVELTRLAIRQEYRTKSPVFLITVAKEFQAIHALGFEYAFTTAAAPSPCDLYLKMGMQRCENIPPFKYEIDDPNEVELVFFDLAKDMSSARSKNLISMADKMMRDSS